MTEAMYDLMYIIDTLVRIIMMISITSITIYFIKFFKSRLRRKSNLTIKQLNKVEEKPCVIGLYFVNLYIIKKEENKMENARAIRILKGYLKVLEEKHNAKPSKDEFVKGMYLAGEGELGNAIKLLEADDEQVIDGMALEDAEEDADFIIGLGEAEFYSAPVGSMYKVWVDGKWDTRYVKEEGVLELYDK